MALRSNGNTFSSTGVQHFGVTAALSAYPHVLNQNFAQTNRIRNLTAGEGITDDKVGLPMGYVDKGWMMPQKAGMISSRGANFGFTDTGTILGGKALETTPPEPSFGFTAVATGGLVSTVPAAGAPATFGFATNAPLLTASLSGDGSATFGFSFANALLGALGGMTVTAEFGMDGTLTSHAIGIMEGTTAESGVTIDNIVTALETAVLPVNIVKVNDYDVTGNGQSGTEWGPA